MVQTARMVERDLVKLGNKGKAKNSQRFFKTKPGEYGYGDIFIGVTVPEQRIIAKGYSGLPLQEIKKLLQNKIHECRLTALIILGTQFKQADEKTRKRIVKFYLAHIQYVNNWDLVDASARYILGEYLLDKNREILFKLACSKNMWERRIAIVATHAFIVRGDVDDTLRVGEVLLSDSHDLVHKSTGWMLREVGKKSLPSLKKFIDKHIFDMPRTMLRYAIERFPEKERTLILARKA